MLRQKRNNSLITDFLLLCKDRKDPFQGMTIKSVLKGNNQVGSVYYNTILIINKYHTQCVPKLTELYI